VCLLALGLVLGLQSLAGAEGRTIVKFWSDLVVEDAMRVRDAAVIGGHITVNGIVEHDVVALGGSVMLGPESVVGRNVVSVGGAIDKSEGAEVQGDIVEVNIPALASGLTSVFRDNWQGLRWAFQIIALIAFIGFLALALLVIALLPKPVGLVSAAVENHTLKAAMWGLLGMVMIVPLAIFLAVSVVGLVLMPLYGFLVACAFLAGYIAVAHLIGKKILAALKKADRPMLWETFLGLIVLWAIGWVPIVGWMVNGAVGLLGLGGVIACLISARKA
jgi:MFS family permease